MFSNLLERIFKTNKDDNISSEKEKIVDKSINNQEQVVETASTKVDVILESAKYNKALVARDIRVLVGLSFEESYDLIEKQNVKIKEKLDIEEAKIIKNKLENLNAIVTLK